MKLTRTLINPTELTDAERAAYNHLVNATSGDSDRRIFNAGILSRWYAQKARDHGKGQAPASRFSRPASAMMKKLWDKGWLVIVDHKYDGQPIYNLADHPEQDL